MKKITFSPIEACILYAFPKNGGIESDIGDRYAFINRDAKLDDDIVKACLGKAARVGIVFKTPNDSYGISDEWFKIIHQFDERTENEIFAMLEFEEYLLSKEWSVLFKNPDLA